jgi:hypothetical protein
MIANRHPVDELADIRAQIRELKAKEDDLRSVILAGNCSLLGCEYKAAISKHSVSRLDQAAAVRELGMERLRPFMTNSEFTVVKVTEL